MDEKKIQKKRLQIVFSTLVFALLFFMQMYAMINYEDYYTGIIIVAALIALYVLINGIIEMIVIKNAKSEEQYESILKAEKATYLMQKKHFADIEERLIHIEKASSTPTEEIINAQKGIAKIVVGRSKENAEALMRSNDLLLEKLGELEKQIYSNNQDLLNEEKVHRSESIQQLLDKQQQLLIDIKDMELRLNSEILQSQKMIAEQKSIFQQPVVQQVPVMQSVQQPMMEQAELLEPESIEEEKKKAIEEPEAGEIIEEPVVEDLSDSFPEELALGDSIEETLEGKPIFEPLEVEESELGIEDISTEESELGIEDISAEEPGLEIEDISVEEPELEIEDISAEEPELELEEEAAIEEEPEAAVPEVDLSDPNKPMSPDEIAALIASMGAESNAEPEKPDETESIEESGTEESEPEKPDEAELELDKIADDEAELEVIETSEAEKEEEPKIDLSDPNKQMSPDEIAALFATLR